MRCQCVISIRQQTVSTWSKLIFSIHIYRTTKNWKFSSCNFLFNLALLYHRSISFKSTPWARKPKVLVVNSHFGIGINVTLMDYVGQLTCLSCNFRKEHMNQIWRNWSLVIATQLFVILVKRKKNKYSVPTTVTTHFLPRKTDKHFLSFLNFPARNSL